MTREQESQQRLNRCLAMDALPEGERNAAIEAADNVVDLREIFSRERQGMTA